jgi:hypothetical protein
VTDFRQALNIAIAELTPQPWDFTDGSGTTLTVIPAGLKADAGEAEVMIRVTADKTLAAEIGIATAAMPELLTALKDGTAWEHVTILDDVLTVTPAPDGGTVITVLEVGYATSSYDSRYETTTAIHVPARQRMPLASALSRATDVARGWED